MNALTLEEKNRWEAHAAKDNSHVNKLDAGVFLHDLGTRVKGEVVISTS